MEKHKLFFHRNGTAGAHELAKSLRSEYVLSATGVVSMRPEETDKS